MMTLVTSFNKRLFESKYQVAWESVKKTYPDCPFMVYHENSYELRLHQRQIDFPEVWSKCNLIDMFQEIPWLGNFIDKFPDAPEIDYWRHNAKYWFRKISSLGHAAYKADTKFLVWMDCDVYFRRPMPDDLLAWFDQHDISCILRKGRHTETGFIVFKLSDATRAFISELQRKYTSMEFLSEDRWDDCHMFDKCIRESKNLKIGGLSKRFGCPYYVPREVIYHYKGPLSEIRNNENM